MKLLKLIIAKIIKFNDYIHEDAKAAWITSGILLVLMWIFAIWILASKS